MGERRAHQTLDRDRRQEGACVDAAFSKLRRQIGMIREFVPELRNMEDPELIDWPSREPVGAPL